MKRGSFVLHVGGKILVVLIFGNGSSLAENAKINPLQKLPTIQYYVIQLAMVQKEIELNMQIQRNKEAKG